MPSPSEDRPSHSAGDLISQTARIIGKHHRHGPVSAPGKLIEGFLSTLSRLTESRATVTLELSGNSWHVDGQDVCPSEETFLNSHLLAREFRRRGLGRITFHRSLTFEDVRAFSQSFIESARAPDPFGALCAGLTAISALTLGALRKAKEEREPALRRRVMRCYFAAASCLRRLMLGKAANDTAALPTVKKIVESLIDGLFEAEGLFFALASVKDYDGYGPYHSVHVSILSMGLGKRLGMPRKTLTELGIVALMHDIGRMGHDARLLSRQGGSREKDRHLIKGHPVEGVKRVLGRKELDVLSVRTAIVSFEHHLNLDLSGYPKVSVPFSLDLYTRIVSIANEFDSLTSSRIHPRLPLAPDKAVRVLADLAGALYDPLLVRLFIGMIGWFPAGSLVLLDTGELAIVRENNPDLPDRPEVLLVTDGSGNRVKATVRDLADKGEGGRYPRTILKTLDPHRYRISLASHLFGRTEV